MAYKTNPFLGVNPYLPRMPMQTPDQYRADLLRQLQPNLDMYNQQYNAYQQQANLMANSGNYVKVTSYEEVRNLQAPSDGRPIIIIDDANGFLYSKKFENGQEYIKAFRLVPNEAVTNGTPNEENSIKCDKNEENDTLKSILDRLDKLEGKNNGVSGHTDEPLEGAEPSGV